ncbi:hypothetical protein M405DRAFT_805186 [Rhizopogon salebrosus TDB-379]|nr:hypothetical protein M405DRAFT_805186 [Rhizopogon salebrosus TDB-379]
MPTYLVTLKSIESYDATKLQVEKQGGTVIEDSAMRDLGIMTVQMPSEDSVKELQSLDSDIDSVEPDQTAHTTLA